MTKNALTAIVLSALALSSAACSWGGEKAKLVNPNIYPTDYKHEVVATLRTVFVKNATTSVSGALISPPVLTAVDKDQRYTMCVHYTAHGNTPGYVGVATRRGYFYDGHLNQLVPVTEDECAGVAYQPFPELDRVCIGAACTNKGKSKGGFMGLF